MHAGRPSSSSWYFYSIDCLNMHMSQRDRIGALNNCTYRYFEDRWSDAYMRQLPSSEQHLQVQVYHDHFSLIRTIIYIRSIPSSHLPLQLPLTIQLLEKPPNPLIKLVHPLVHLVLATKTVLAPLALALVLARHVRLL